MALVFVASVFTVLSRRPSESTRHALFDFFSALHQPCRATNNALRYPSGLLNSVVILPLRTGTGGGALRSPSPRKLDRPCRACGCCAETGPAAKKPMPSFAPMNSLLPVSISAPFFLEIYELPALSSPSH